MWSFTKKISIAIEMVDVRACVCVWTSCACVAHKLKLRWRWRRYQKSQLALYLSRSFARSLACSMSPHLFRRRPPTAHIATPHPPRLQRRRKQSQFVWHWQAKTTIARHLQTLCDNVIGAVVRRVSETDRGERETGQESGWHL